LKQIIVDIPGSKVTYNYLYEDMPVDWREEDLLFVKLPNGYVIDVGWYPACDPAGQFKITLSDPHQNVVDVLGAPELDRVANAVESMARYSQFVGSRPLTIVTKYLKGAALVTSMNSSSSIATTISVDPSSFVSLKVG
jgi:hypothetical protein